MSAIAEKTITDELARKDASQLGHLFQSTSTRAKNETSALPMSDLSNAKSDSLSQHSIGEDTGRKLIKDLLKEKNYRSASQSSCSSFHGVEEGNVNNQQQFEEMDREVAVKKPQKSYSILHKVTLAFTMFSTLLVSINHFTSVGIGIVTNNYLRTNQNLLESMNECNETTSNNTDILARYNLSIHILEQWIQQQPRSVASFIGHTSKYPASSCKALKNINSSLPSGFYWIWPEFEELPVRRYCDMHLMCGGMTGGWMRVSQFDTRNLSNIICPTGLRPQENIFRYYDPLNRGCFLRSIHTCGIPSDLANFCSNSVFITGVPYNKVCGRVIGYQYGNLTGFQNVTNSNSSAYVDGISFTYGNTKEHIWTFAAASNEQPENICPCGRNNTSGVAPPNFVRDHYFCDSAVESGPPQARIYSGDPLWDGIGCNQTLTNCCSFNQPPWFYRKLPNSTTADIQMTMCRKHNSSQADLGIQILDLLVQ